MNSRVLCVLFYAVSLVIYFLVIFSINKYERQKLPVKRLISLSQFFKDNYQNRQKIDEIKSKKKEKYDSSLSIHLYIVSACSEENSDEYGNKLKAFIEEYIKIDHKGEKTDSSFFINDIFYLNLYLINNKTIEDDKTKKYSNICKNVFSKNDSYDFIGNSYYIYVNENSKQQEQNLSFILLTTNVIKIYYNKIKGTKSSNNYEKCISESWNVLKNVFFFKTNNRVIEYIPELDLNFHLASSLYSEKNYKINQTSSNKDEQSINSIGTSENGKTEKNENVDQKTEPENREYMKSDFIYNEEKNTENSKVPVIIATWNFFDNFYYPYLRNFIERLLNVFQINIYSQILSNINILKISEKAQVYTKEKNINVKDNARLILLDKVTKFTNVFDDVAFDNILKKPTYEIPKNINLIAIFPNEEEIFFYNDLNEQIETTVSFLEWGVIHINNMFTRIKNSEKKKRKIINISEEAHIISGAFVSHLRAFLGLCANFNACIYNIFDSHTYSIKHLRTVSSDNDSSTSYLITTKDDLVFSFIYHIPLKNSISDYETLILMREAYTYRLIESLNNLNKIISISNISIYIKIPLYTVNAFNNILNNIECSLSYIEGKLCKFEHINKMLEEKFDSYFKNNNKREMYFKLSLILIQSAYQDSLQLLNDDKITIYDIMSKDFVLSTMLPTVIPFALPIMISLFKEFLKNTKTKKMKVD